MKSEAAVTALPATAAPVVTMTPKRAPRSEKYAKMAKEAAKELGVSAGEIPTSKSRGKETFFDGKVFDPDNPVAYLKSLSIKRAEV